MKFVPGAITAANREILAALEPLWRDGSLSMLDIGGRLGASRSKVAALIARARKRPGGMELFPPRPKSESNRLSAQRKRAIKAGMSLDEIRVALPNAGRRLRPAYSLGTAASPAIKEPEPEPRSSKPGKRLIDLEPGPVPFSALKPGECRYPLNDAERGRLYIDMLCCGEPIVRGSYCANHAAVARVNSSSASSSRFVLRVRSR